MSRRLDHATSPSLLHSGTLNQSLRLLEQVGQASNVGIVKGFAGILNLVLETCQTATSNKKDAEALADDLGHLATAVAGQLKDDISAELLIDISRLCEQLQAVHSVLENLFKRDSVAWFVKHSQDEVRLQRLQRDIKHAIDLFSFQSSVRLQERIGGSEASDAARKDRLLYEIRDVCQAVMDELRTAKQGQEPTPPVVMASGPVLPRAPRHFFGREETIQTVVNMVINPTPARVAILGAAGIGKTSVASMVLFDPQVAEYFGNRRFFIPCDAAKGSKDDLLTAIASALGLQGSKLQKKVLEALGDSQQRLFLVLDNFESPWETTETSKKEVEGLLVALCSLDSLTVLITLRGSERPAGVKWSRPTVPQLGPLDATSARRAFLALSDCVEDDPGIDALTAAVDFVPLAIALMANLAETDSTETLLLRWREEQSSLLNRIPERTSSLDVSIRISLNSHRMNAVPEATVLLSLLSLLPDGIDNTQLAAIFPGIPKLRRALSALWQTSLAYNDGHNRTRVLAPIRAHMTLYSPPDVARRTSMLAYYMGLAELCSDLGGPHGQAIVKRLTPEIGNMHSIVDLVLKSSDEQILRSAVAAAINLSKFSRYTHLGSYENLEAARNIARTLGDESLEADVLYHLSWTIFGYGETSNHEALCSEALAIYERIGSVQGRAECTFLSAQFKKSTKRQKECKALYEEALKLSIESQSKYCEAKCLACLSEITFYSGNADAAERLSREALDLFRQLEHLTNIGMSTFMLGKILAFRNDRAADGWFDEAEVVLKQAGAYSLAGVALIGKGDCAFARCDYHAAQQTYSKALNTFEEAGTLQSSHGAFALLSLGTAAAYLHQYAEAKEYLERTRITLNKTNIASYGLLHCNLIDGDLAFYEGKFGETTTFYQRALTSAETLGFAEEDALCHVKLGTLDIAQGRLQAGLRHVVVAAAKQRRTKDDRGLSQTLVRLGQGFAADGRKDLALGLFRAVYPLCQKIEALRNLAECIQGMGELCEDLELVEEGKRLYAETFSAR
ncbi:hypothetical protein C8F01DRAFT_1131657 [Mycena amicta]|nr:hypothetical protein C8F01DRAFT_1131657 [Mycena amicta]